MEEPRKCIADRHRAGAGKPAAAAVFGRRAWTAKKTNDDTSAQFFALLAFGCFAWASGQFLWFYSRNIQHEQIPNGNFHDIGYLLMPMTVGAALALRARQYGMAAFRRRWLPTVSALSLVGCGYTICVLLLSALHLEVGGGTMLYAVYPATDISLGVVALVPLMFGHRIVGSAAVATAMFAAAASDMGYMLLRANPAETSLPPTAAVGYVWFAILMLVYATVARPISEPRYAPRSLFIPCTDPRSLVASLTSGCACVTIIGAMIVVWLHPPPLVNAIMLAITVVEVGTLAALTGEAAKNQKAGLSQEICRNDRTGKCGCAGGSS